MQLVVSTQLKKIRQNDDFHLPQVRDENKTYLSYHHLEED